MQPVGWALHALSTEPAFVPAPPGTKAIFLTGHRVRPFCVKPILPFTYTRVQVGGGDFWTTLLSWARSQSDALRAVPERRSPVARSFGSGLPWPSGRWLTKLRTPCRSKRAHGHGAS